MKRRVKYILVHIGLVTAGVLGAVYKLQWAWNVFAFVFWWCVVTATLCCTTEKAKELIRKNPRAVPMWIDSIVDVAIALALAATGHFWMASFWIWQSVCSELARQTPDSGKKTATSEA